ncbi:hypothetical protein IJ380_03960 [Candidatus Saccharibacteria bacterium]|nr:hypothetical protein [Candidatus Saccharibacteria bacterium]
MQVKLRNVKSGEVEIVCFPICFPQRADDFPFDDWEVVDLVRPNEEEFEESDIRCASFIYDIEPDKLPGKGEKDSSKELHLFLSRWEDSVVLRDLIDGKWSVRNPRVWVSLLNETNDWHKAFLFYRYAKETGVERNDYKDLGEYYLEKYRERFDRSDDFELGSFFHVCIHDEGFLNVEEYGRRIANNPQNGYWASDLKCWVDCSESDEWKYWVEYGE